MNSALARQAYVTLGNGAVLPHGLVDLELVDAGVRPPPGGVREQSGLTQFSWKVSGLTRAGIRREAMNCRGIGIVDVIKLTVAAEAGSVILTVVATDTAGGASQARDDAT